MWSYYGAKTNIIKFYPAPKHDKIIEPFCGTARYALRYFDHDILLVDKYDVIIKIWKWLQKCSPQDILSLPRFKAGENINNYTYDCEEQRFLVGFLVGFGFPNPRKTAIPRLRNRPNAMNYTINRIAKQLWKIKHWEIKLGSYDEISNQVATWFIDPPYQYGGHVYKHSNKHINYTLLSDWCKNRGGQIIVCENSNATWMNFTPMINQNILSGNYMESIWSNEPCEFYNKQQEIIFQPLV
jgi:hypothetical protein